MENNIKKGYLLELGLLGFDDDYFMKRWITRKDLDVLSHSHQDWFLEESNDLIPKAREIILRELRPEFRKSNKKPKWLHKDEYITLEKIDFDIPQMVKNENLAGCRHGGNKAFILTPAYMIDGEIFKKVILKIRN
jgi:hypothetical protein